MIMICLVIIFGAEWFIRLFFYFASFIALIFAISLFVIVSF